MIDDAMISNHANAVPRITPAHPSSDDVHNIEKKPCQSSSLEQLFFPIKHWKSQARIQNSTASLITFYTHQPLMKSESLVSTPMINLLSI